MSTPFSGLPPANFPIADPQSGGISLWWYQLLLALFQRTGGAAGVDLTTIQTDIAAIITAVQAAATIALAADAAANAAQTTANTAVANAATAQSTANTATVIADNALVKSSNLADLTSPQTARSNLGVNTVPLVMSFPAAPSGSLYLPITQNITISPAFAGTVTYAAVAPTANATFTLSVLHGAYGLAIGTITLSAGSNTINIKAAIAAYALYAGDVLRLDAPIVPDATLNNVTFTLRTTV